MGLYSFFHFDMILFFVGLCSKRMHCGSLGSIKHLALNKRFIYIYSHLSAECIDFYNQMSFTRSSD